VVLIYLVSTLMAARLADTPFNEFNLFHPKDNSPFIALAVLHPLSLFCGMMLILFVPGVLLIPLLIRKRLDPVTFLAYSTVTNIALYIAGGSLLKLFGGEGLHRINFMVMISLLTAILSLLLFGRRGVQRIKYTFQLDYMKAAIFGIIAIACLFLTQDYWLGALYAHDFSEGRLLQTPLGKLSDKLEIIGVTESLRTHLWPYWALEYSDRMGFFVLNPPLRYFWFLHSTLLFGNSFVPYVAIFFLSIMMIVMMSFYASQFQIQSQNRFCFILLPLFISYIYYVSASKMDFLLNAFHILAMLPLFLHYYFLIKRQFKAALIFSAISFLISYESVFFVLIGLIVFRCVFKNDRGPLKTLIKQYTIVLAAYLCFIGVLGLIHGDAGTYAEILLVEKLMRFDYLIYLEELFPQNRGLLAEFRLSGSWDFMVHILEVSMGLVIVLLLPKRDKFARFFSWIGIAYVLALLVATYQRPHYVIPLVVMTAFVAPRYLYNLNLTLRQKFQLKS